MAKRIKFKAVNRQAYGLARNIIRDNKFPKISSGVNPTALRARGYSDEDIAHLYECPVEEVGEIISFDQETNRVKSANEKEFQKAYVGMEKELDKLEVSIGIF